MYPGTERTPVYITCPNSFSTVFGAYLCVKVYLVLAKISKFTETPLFRVEGLSPCGANTENRTYVVKILSLTEQEIYTCGYSKTLHLSWSLTLNLSC